MAFHRVPNDQQNEATDNENEAMFNLSTMLVADGGTPIRGEQIYDLIHRAKAEGKTLASKAREIPNVAITTFVSPGRGVVEMAERSGRRGKRS